MLFTINKVGEFSGTIRYKVEMDESSRCEMKQNTKDIMDATCIETQTETESINHLDCT